MTHLSATASEPAVGHRAHRCGSTRKDTFSVVEFNCISGKTEDKSNHFLVQIVMLFILFNSLPYLEPDS